MKLVLLFIYVFIHNTSYTMIVKDPNLKLPKGTTVTNIQEVMPSYNPYSLYVPTPELLAQLPADRVLDMGGSAYGQSFLTKALYFYTNTIALFPNNSSAVSWAAYEAGYIYYQRRNKEKALEYFNQVLETKGAPMATENLAKTMINRIVNTEQYKVFLKQEDILFVEDKKAQAEINRMISKEERAAEKVRRELSKERKKREKEEAKALKEAEKARKAAQKEAEKKAKEDAAAQQKAD